MPLFDRFRSDESLLQAYSKGSMGAFEQLYARYKDNLYAFVLASVREKAQAEDVAHDAWLAVMDKAEQFEAKKEAGAKPFKRWLFRIAHHKVIDAWRKQQRYVAEPEDDVESEAFDIAEAQEDKALGPEGLTLLAEVLDKVASLPEAQSQTWLLQKLGFSLQDIADITETKEESVKSRLRYANAKLKQLLGSES